MKILLTAATAFEIAPVHQYLHEQAWPHSGQAFQRDNLFVEVQVTGVGAVPTAFALAKLFAGASYDLALNVGIAGAFDRSLQLGEVVNVVSERFADVGVEEQDGRFTDVHELGLTPPDAFPFTAGELRNPQADGFSFAKNCKGLTVNKVHGSLASIEAVRAKYPAEIETMEGAAFFYACLLSGVPFLQLRSISNYVEPRNRDAWDLPLAIANLNSVVRELLETLAS